MNQGILVSLSVIFVVILFPQIVYAENLTFKDNFPNGRAELRWAFFPYFNLDNLEGARDSKAPDGDNGIGVLKNTNAGGFASLSYAVTRQVENFYLEAMVYCPVTEGNKGPLSGIAFLIDPIKGSFYRFVCDFKTNDPTLNLAFVGVYVNFVGGLGEATTKVDGFMLKEE
jgi:hypothetical protein